MMMFTAVVGLIFNLIQMQILHDDTHGHGHSHGDDGHDHGNMNVDQAFLHALSDMLNSIGVCIAAVIIWIWPTAKIADPICAFIFAILVVVQCKPLISDCVLVLMEAAPGNIDQKKLIEAIKECGTDVGIHDFHLWQISKGRLAMSCHVHCAGESMKTLKAITEVCKSKPYKIEMVTIQIEDTTQEDYQMHCESSPGAYNVERDASGGHDHDHGHAHHH